MSYLILKLSHMIKKPFLGRTQKIKIDNKWKDDFERGKTDKFEITAVNLGNLKGVILSKKVKYNCYTFLK